MRTHVGFVLGLLLLLVLVPLARAEEEEKEKERDAAAAQAPKLVVAVVAVRAGTEDLESLAGSLPAFLESSLATLPGLTLVTRADLDRIQEEQQLNLAGLVEQGRGAQVGKLIGADVLVVGRVARIDDELLLTAKAIGAETGAILPAIARGREQDGAAALAGRLADALGALLEERGAELLPAASSDDAKAEAAVKKRIDALELDVALPRLALFVPERHLRTERVPDPAAETAILEIVRRLGFAVAPVPGDRERAWLTKAARGEADFPAPPTLEADLAVVGEAFSEYAGRVGRFVSCRARVEIRVYDVQTGLIVATHVGKGSGADLSERFAGKQALEALGREAALAIALDLARTVASPVEER